MSRSSDFLDLFIVLRPLSHWSGHSSYSVLPPTAGVWSLESRGRPVFFVFCAPVYTANNMGMMVFELPGYCMLTHQLFVLCYALRRLTIGDYRVCYFRISATPPKKWIESQRRYKLRSNEIKNEIKKGHNLFFFGKKVWKEFQCRISQRPHQLLHRFRAHPLLFLLLARYLPSAHARLLPPSFLLLFAVQVAFPVALLSLFPTHRQHISKLLDVYLQTWILDRHLMLRKTGQRENSRRWLQLRWQ